MRIFHAGVIRGAITHISYQRKPDKESRATLKSLHLASRLAGGIDPKAIRAYERGLGDDQIIVAGALASRAKLAAPLEEQARNLLRIVKDGPQSVPPYTPLLEGFGRVRGPENYYARIEEDHRRNTLIEYGRLARTIRVLRDTSGNPRLGERFTLEGGRLVSLEGAAYRSIQEAEGTKNTLTCAGCAGLVVFPFAAGLAPLEVGALATGGRWSEGRATPCTSLRPSFPGRRGSSRARRCSGPPAEARSSPRRGRRHRC